MKVELRYRITGRVMTMALVGVIMVCVSCLVFLYNPLQMILRKFLTLSPGSMFFSLWETPPYDVVMKIYIFNVTNAEEFLRGEEKLNFTQSGPYAYKEVLTNNNATFHDDGTVTYSPYRDFHPDEANSVANPLTERIIVPNIPVIGIQSFLTDSSFVTNIGFSTLAASMGAPSFVNLTVNEYLWGYEDKLVSLANQFIPSWIDFGKFGILERLMDRDNHNEVTISVKPGQSSSQYAQQLTQEELMSEYHIIKWNGLHGLKEWGFDEKNESAKSTKKCQLVEGAFDGTIFPTPLRKYRNVTIYRHAFCRPVPLMFVNENVNSQGIKVYNYKMGEDLFSSPDINPFNECFCSNGKCPEKGLQNIAPCYYGLPIVLSQPHFLNGDPAVINSFNGIDPIEEKHGSIAKIQPDVGIPMDGSMLRIQVNLGVSQTRFNSKTRPFNGLTLPLLWIELGCTKLPSFVDWLLTLVFDVLPVCQDVLSYFLGIVGLAIISGAALLTLFFSKAVPRSLSISPDYSAIPLISIPAQYLREKELRICK
ncbi:scavenger receptor class B member 1 [Leptinotarsa decemlineata]|uniref:scavenger receptor class B member 1 n=1 Tax=Leptinotarsa decemlineata TaxID=7539 RepID=UPI000C25388F|nr:scavenger receptor class B member 1-like [Leptinotarsa decemlineata]